MLHLMRRFASTWVGKILGGLILVAMASFGVPTILATLNANTVATVGNEDITIQAFQRSYQQQLNNFAQQYGQLPTNEQALQMGIPGYVINLLASNAAINQTALNMGIGVSDARLAKQVREDPSFAGVLGTFERANFQQVLQQNGYTEAEYFDLQTRAARRQQIMTGLLAGSPVPKTAADLLNRYRHDTRTVEYFTLNSTSLPDIATPTDADLQKYLADNQATFRTKETRTIDALYLTPEILSAQPEYQPTEDEVKAEYDRTKDQLVKVEKRAIQQVSLPNADAEKVFTDALAAGTPFADALKASGLSAVDIGTLAKAEVQDAALAEAAFGLAKAGDFAIIPGVGGKRVVAVTDIQAGGQTSYDDAKATITKNLAVAKAKNAYADVQDQIESLRAALKPLSEIADRFKLAYTTVAVTAAGSELTAPATPENKKKVADAVFKATEGKLAPTVTFSANENLWFDLKKVDAARDQTLDEVRDAVTFAWTNTKTNDALQAEVKAILAELDSGKPFQDVAASRSQFATISQPITRDGDGTTVLNAQVANAIFGQGPDSHGSAIDGDGDYLVYHVVDVTPATDAPDKAINDFLSTNTRNGLYSEFIDGIRDEAGIKINQQVLSQLLNLDQAQ